MAKWVDKTMEKPKEPYKQNIKFKNSYNDYGFDYNNTMYSIPEENRDFRKNIQYEIVMEEMKTQNILGQHITDETDRAIQEVNENTDTRATEVKNLINVKTDYIITTLSNKITRVENKVDNATTKIEQNKTLLDTIWAKVETLRNAVIG